MKIENKITHFDLTYESMGQKNVHMQNKKPFG